MNYFNEFINKYKKDISGKDDIENFIDKIRAVLKSKKIILIGGVAHGRTVLNLLNDLDIKVFAVIDRNPSVVNINEDVHVYCYDFLRNIDADEYIIMASVNHKNYESILDYLSDMGMGHLKNELVNEYDIHLTIQKCVCFLKSKKGRLNIVNCSGCTQLNHTCDILRDNIIKYKKDACINEKGADITLIGGILGTVCTLKCKHCVEHVPYVLSDNRKFFDKDVIIKDINRIAKCCKYVTVVDFVGGEPFLHPDLDIIIENVRKINNVGIVNVFTNGTVMPKEKLLHQLKQEFVTVSLSNYSKNLSDEQHKKIIETRKVFINTEGVEFFEAENFTWMDTRSFDYVGDSKQKMINRFENCKLKDCYRLYNGKMFRCLHHYAGYVTGKLHIDSSVVDINDIEDDSKLVDALNRFINVDYIDVCNYCELPFKAEAVSSGEQLI